MIVNSLKERLRSVDREHVLESSLDYGKIVVGSLIVALGINMFILPSKLVYGGVTGICVILYHKLGIPMGLALAVLNAPLIYLGWRYGGRRKFLSRTIVGTITLALGVEVLGMWVEPPTHERLLVIFYGGLLDGLGLALIFHGQGTTGGSDVLGYLCNEWKGIGVGQTMMMFNVLVYAIGVTQFGFEAVMVAFMLAFVSARTLDAALLGFSSTRAVFIISSRHSEMKDAVIRHFRRGVTVLSAKGGYTGEERPVLYIVVPPSQIPRLKREVLAIDPYAFFSATPSQDMLGGFPGPRRKSQRLRPPPEPDPPDASGG